MSITPAVALPAHPYARRSLILGLVGMIGFFCLLLPALLCPFAWYYGAFARREIARAPDQWGGRSDANTGMICGIVGTALLCLALLLASIVVGSMALLLTFEAGYGS